MRMQQQAQLNAPDPRVLSQPPCYEDAILMPRLDASFASLNELGRSKNKRGRRKTVTQNDNENDEEVTVRRNRCRSEEILSMRDSTNVRSPRLTPRAHPMDISPIDRNRSSNEDEESEEAEEIHYHSTDILTLRHSPGPSHRVHSSISGPSHRAPSLPHTPPPRRNAASESFEEIRNFDRSNNADNDRSPYAKRKLGHMDSFKGNKKQFKIPKVHEPSTSIAAATVVPSTDEIIVIDDHFGASRKSISSSEGSSEFVNISASRNSDVNSSSTEDGMVILHKPPTK